MSDSINRQPKHRQPRWSDLDIQALVDGELDPQTEKKLHQVIKNNDRARARYEYLQDQKALLKAWWKTFF